MSSCYWIDVGEFVCTDVVCLPSRVNFVDHERMSPSDVFPIDLSSLQFSMTLVVFIVVVVVVVVVVWVMTSSCEKWSFKQRLEIVVAYKMPLLLYDDCFNSSYTFACKFKFSGYHCFRYLTVLLWSCMRGLSVFLTLVDMTPPPTQPISLRLDNVLPVVNPRHVQLLGPQVCRKIC